jgi:ABC-type transport system involved in multi-copper enzyme maturation permease subunit
MIGNEYSNGTLKQNLIDGLSKKEMILSKFYFIVAYAFIVTALVFFITLFIGLANAPKSNMFLDIIFDGTEYIVAYFFKLVAFFSLCFFAGVIIKRSAFALGALFIVFITEMILLALTWNEWANEQVAVAIFKYMPFTSMWRLINQPVYRMANVNNPDSQLITDYAVHGYEIAIASGWIFISIFLSYQLLKRRDL